MKRFLSSAGRIELVLALAAAGLAALAGGYLLITTLAARESCYGVSGARIRCQALTDATFAKALTRIVVTLSIVLALYAGGALAAWWQSRARLSDARTTAYMAMLTCAVTVLAITLPALQGVGFFFVPSTLLLLVAALVGLVALVRSNRAERHAMPVAQTPVRAE